jgi:hypothetical protein
MEWTDDGAIRHPSFQGLREDRVQKKLCAKFPMPSQDVASKRKENKTRPRKLKAFLLK